MDSRCNGEYDCEDKSDESDCNIIDDNQDYQKELPPKSDGELLDVSVSIQILNIEKIELPSTFHAKIEVSLSWRDYRLHFFNIHENNILNPKAKHKIWIPPLLFSNSNENQKIQVDEKATISITKLQGESRLIHETTQNLTST